MKASVNQLCQNCHFCSEVDTDFCTFLSLLQAVSLLKLLLGQIEGNLAALLASFLL